LLIFIHVEFCKFNTSCVFMAQFIKKRYNSSSRRAPWGPAAHDNRTRECQYLVVKIAIRYIIRKPLIKGRTAFPAYRPMMELFFFHDIFCSAGQASQNELIKICTASSTQRLIAHMISMYPVLLSASETSYNEIIHRCILHSTNSYLH
jgi:hypothetical protein